MKGKPTPGGQLGPTVSTGCDYQGYEFGAGHYPDSVCIGGRLYNADNCDDAGNLYEPAEDMPCPMCRPRDAVKWWAETMYCSGNTRRASRDAAKSLVADIRKNRGVFDMAANAALSRTRPAKQQ